MVPATFAEAVPIALLWRQLAGVFPQTSKGRGISAGVLFHRAESQGVDIEAALDRKQLQGVLSGWQLEV
jgi:hypothetical protein